MWSLPKPGYDPETMRAVALAYLSERQAGRLDQPAREAAIAVFRARHGARTYGGGLGSARFTASW
jgi:hypothetical protein